MVGVHEFGGWTFHEKEEGTMEWLRGVGSDRATKLSCGSGAGENPCKGIRHQQFENDDDGTTNFELLEDKRN